MSSVEPRLHRKQLLARATAVIVVSPATYDEIRRLLIEQGSAGVIDERGPRQIDMTGVTIQRALEP